MTYCPNVVPAVASNSAVKAVFDTYPKNIRRELLSIRKLIFTTASTIEGVGKLTETLKWGEPAYLTTASKSGSTIRLGWKSSAPSQYAMYFNCNTNLVDTFRTLFPKQLVFQGNRAIVFEESTAIPVDAVTLCIASALTYHRDKKST